MLYNEDHLDTLRLKQSDLDLLSEEDQKRKIRQSYYKLAILFHPDRNPDNPLAKEQFQKLQKAYVEIDKPQGKVVSISGLNDYFTAKEISIPETAFDLLMQENIINAYEALQKQFTTLATEQEKKAFAQHYANFIEVAQSIEASSDKLNSNRGMYLFEQLNASFAQQFVMQWREFIIRLFAEEYLDDFEYRHALATGDLYPILVTRKLVSPIKLLVAVLNSILLSIKFTAHYLATTVMTKVALDFMHQYFAYKQGQAELGKILFILGKIVFLIFALTLSYYLLPTLFVLGFGIPIIFDVLNCLASPINILARPLASYTGFSPITSALLLGVVAATALSIFSSAALVIGAIPMLWYLSWGLDVYCYYLLAKFIYKFYEINPALGLFQGLITTIAIIANLLIPSVDETPLYIIGYFLTNLSQIVLLKLILTQLEQNDIAGLADKIEILPLPKETIPASLKEATLLGHKTALYSNRFFNTPKEAEFLLPEDRTFYQGFSSFFGGGMKPHKETPIHAMSEEQPLLLEMASTGS